MSEAAPWRALEDSPPSGGGNAAGTSTSGSATTVTGASRLGWVVGALVVAALMIVAAVWLVASGGSGTLVVEGGGPVPGRSDPAGIGTVAGTPGPVGAAGVVVDVQGAVVRPGIVELAAGSRVADAIAAAGGYGPRVAADRVAQVLNLAALLKDGDQIVVPSRDDPVATAPAGGSGSSGSGGGAGSPTGPIDLNWATVAELDSLPGIGPVTAAKIVAAREEQAFASVEDLRTRKILGAATFEKVKDLVVVR